MQPSIAIVNDLSGFGRCSLTVSLPILSSMGISCGVVPTAILSNQTEYPEYSMLDFTPYMEEYLHKWKKLGFKFDGLYTGFLGSVKQIHIIKKMIDDFSFKNILVDPVMGDHGVIYDSYTSELCDGMRELVTHATIITPNLTELCILTNKKYRSDITEEEIKAMCIEIAQQGPKKVVVTGIEKGDQLGNAIYDHDHDRSFEVIYGKKVLPLRPGTGDVFASIIAGNCIHKNDLKTGVLQAMEFICTCLETSSKLNVPINDGVCFEEHLHLLHKA